MVMVTLTFKSVFPSLLMLSGQMLAGLPRDVLPEPSVCNSTVKPFAYSVQWVFIFRLCFDSVYTTRFWLIDCLFIFISSPQMWYLHSAHSQLVLISGFWT